MSLLICEWTECAITDVLFVLVYLRMRMELFHYLRLTDSPSCDFFTMTMIPPLFLDSGDGCAIVHIDLTLAT